MGPTRCSIDILVDLPTDKLKGGLFDPPLFWGKVMGEVGVGGADKNIQ